MIVFCLYGRIVCLSLHLVVTRMFKSQDCFILSNDNLETIDGTATANSMYVCTQKGQFHLPVLLSLKSKEQAVCQHSNGKTTHDICQFRRLIGTAVEYIYICLSVFKRENDI